MINIADPIGSFISFVLAYKGELTILYKAFINYFAGIYRFTLILAPILCTVFIIIGGLNVTLSSGRPDRLESAKHIIEHAIAGCVVVLLSYPIISTLSYFFVPNYSSPLNLFMDIAIGIANILGVIYVAMGGFGLIVSADNPEKVLKAKRTIFYAIAGYIYLLLLRVVVG